MDYRTQQSYMLPAQLLGQFLQNTALNMCC